MTSKWVIGSIWLLILVVVWATHKLTDKLDEVVEELRSRALDAADAANVQAEILRSLKRSQANLYAVQAASERLSPPPPTEDPFAAFAARAADESGES